MFHSALCLLPRLLRRYRPARLLLSAFEPQSPRYLPTFVPHKWARNKEKTLNLQYQTRLPSHRKRCFRPLLQTLRQMHPTFLDEGNAIIICCLGLWSTQWTTFSDATVNARIRQLDTRHAYIRSLFTCRCVRGSLPPSNALANCPSLEISQM